VTAVGPHGRFVYKGHPDGNFQVDAEICKRFGMVPPDPYPQPPVVYVDPDHEAEDAVKAIQAPPADKAVHAPPENKTLTISPKPSRPHRRR